MFSVFIEAMVEDIRENPGTFLFELGINLLAGPLYLLLFADSWLNVSIIFALWVGVLYVCVWRGNL